MEELSTAQKEWLTNALRNSIYRYAENHDLWPNELDQWCKYHSGKAYKSIELVVSLFPSEMSVDDAISLLGQEVVLEIENIVIKQYLEDKFGKKWDSEPDIPMMYVCPNWEWPEDGFLPENTVVYSNELSKELNFSLPQYDIYDVDGVMSHIISDAGERLYYSFNGGKYLGKIRKIKGVKVERDNYMLTITLLYGNEIEFVVHKDLEDWVEKDEEDFDQLIAAIYEASRYIYYIEGVIELSDLVFEWESWG